MMTIADRLAAVPFRRLAWLLPATFALHEAEEWNITAWYRQQFINPPATTDLAVRTLLVGFVVLAFAWTALGLRFKRPATSAHFVLPLFVPFVFANNLQHVYWQIAFDAYAPGFIASAFLNAPAILLLSWHARRNRLVSRAYLAVLYLLSLPPLISVARAGRTVTPAALAMHELGVRLSGLLIGPS